MLAYNTSLALRGRAVAARRAHNPEVSGSNPLPATEREPESVGLWFFVSPAHSGRLIPVQTVGAILFVPGGQGCSLQPPLTANTRQPVDMRTTVFRMQKT